MDYKLRVKTKEQRALVEGHLIVSEVSEDGCRIRLNCESVSFDEMEEIIDCIRPKDVKSIYSSIVSEEMREVVDTWMQYKKEKGQSYKPSGFKTFYKRLCELSGNNPQIAMQIIENSMQSNYAGIFPISNRQPNTHINGREERAKDAADLVSRLLAENDA